MSLDAGETRVCKLVGVTVFGQYAVLKESLRATY